MIKVCFVNPQKSGIGYHRLEVPFSNLNKDYTDLSIVGCNGFSLAHLPTQFDVIVLNRHSWQDEPYIQRAKDAGVKIVLDLDDHITLPDWHTARDGIKTPIIEQRINETIEIADQIWCASEYLQTKINKPSIYVPNAIDFTQPQFIPNKKKNDKYVVGWIGAANHQHDIELLYEPLKKLLGKKDYAILLGGVSKADQNTASYWEYIINLMTSVGNLPKEQFIKVDAQNVYNYAFMYNLMDLALAPLHKSEFTKCKSNIKVLEAGAFSLPIICSNIEPYKEFISKGLVYCSDGNWDGRIKDLIKHPIKGRQMGAKLHEYVKENYNIKKINQIRYDSILSLVH
jgi:glycosyltransferase involved in cell wall biosynthesis